MLFSQVVGQRMAKEGLLHMERQHHLPHALLIAGAEGTGGLPMALALAQYIFCSNRSDTDACGACPDCQKVSKLEHADLHLSFPSIPPKPKAKTLSRFFMEAFRAFISQTPYGTTYDWLQSIQAENKQGNISADECREMIELLNLKSYEGGRKVLLIWRAEYLGKVGNMLLKMIEEPPAGTIIILVAEEPAEVLPTILSRTQLIRLSPLSPADIEQALLQRRLAEPRLAAQIAHMAQGSFTEALSLLRHAGDDLFPALRGWFNALFTNNGLELSVFAETWSKAGREQQKNFLHYVIQLLEQCLRFGYLPQLALPLPPEEAGFVQKLAGRGLSPLLLQRMVEAITDTVGYIERNAHSRTQLHALSIRLQHIIQNKALNSQTI